MAAKIVPDIHVETGLAKGLSSEATARLLADVGPNAMLDVTTYPIRRALLKL